MTYKIIGDSCLDLTEDMKKDPISDDTAYTAGGHCHRGG